MNWLIIAALLEVLMVCDKSVCCHDHQPFCSSGTEPRTKVNTISSAPRLAKLRKPRLSYLSFNTGHSLTKQDTQSKPQAQAKVDSNKPNNSYLNLVLRIQRNGDFKVIKAALLPGRLAMRSTPISDYIYEVYTPEEDWFVASLAEDPFVQRSFSKSEKGGESVKATSATTIIVNIPEIDEAFISVHKLGLRLNKLKSAASFDVLTLEVFRSLRREDLLIVVLDLPPERLGPAIRRMINKRAP